MSNKLQTQPNANKSGCYFWMSVCTWILHCLMKSTSRNKVKAFNVLNSWHSLRTACIPDLIFPKIRQRYFSSTCLFDTDFKELIMKHLVWSLIGRVMDINCSVFWCSFPEERFSELWRFLCNGIAVAQHKWPIFKKQYGYSAGLLCYMSHVTLIKDIVISLLQSIVVIDLNMQTTI